MSFDELWVLLNKLNIEVTQQYAKKIFAVRLSHYTIAQIVVDLAFDTNIYTALDKTI